MNIEVKYYAPDDCWFVVVEHNNLPNPETFSMPLGTTAQMEDVYRAIGDAMETVNEEIYSQYENSKD